MNYSVYSAVIDRGAKIETSVYSIRTLGLITFFSFTFVPRNFSINQCPVADILSLIRMKKMICQPNDFLIRTPKVSHPIKSIDAQL